MNLMFEPIMAIVLIVAIARIAITDDQSGIIWGAVAFLTIGVCMLIPIPYARVLIAGVLTYAMMTAYKVIANK